MKSQNNSQQHTECDAKLRVLQSVVGKRSVTRYDMAFLFLIFWHCDKSVHKTAQNSFHMNKSEFNRLLFLRRPEGNTFSGRT